MDKNSNNENLNLNSKDAGVLVLVEQSNHCAERAYWWMKGVDKEDAERLGVADKVQSVLSLLQKIDNITIDISITIKNKSQQ